MKRILLMLTVLFGVLSIVTALALVSVSIVSLTCKVISFKKASESKLREYILEKVGT